MSLLWGRQYRLDVYVLFYFLKFSLIILQLNIVTLKEKDPIFKIEVT